MAAKLTRLTHKIAIQLHVVAESCTICSSLSRLPVQLHVVAESCTICSSLSRLPVRKLLDSTSYTVLPDNEEARPVLCKLKCL
jgi:hypothetical protein